MGFLSHFRRSRIFGDQPLVVVSRLWQYQAPSWWRYMHSERQTPILPMQAQAASFVAIARGSHAPAKLITTGLPVFTAVIPLCTLPDSRGLHSLEGVDLMGFPATRIHCRQQGRNLTMELESRGGASGRCLCRGDVAAHGLDPLISGRKGCCPAVHICGLALGGSAAVACLDLWSEAKAPLAGTQNMHGACCAGYAEMEVQLANVLSAPRAILVLPDPLAVAEVRQLEADAAGVPDVDSFLRNAGLVVQYLHRQDAPNQEGHDVFYTSELGRRIARIAQELVVATAARGWPALARLLLPGTTAGGLSAREALAAMDAICPTSSLSGLATGAVRDVLTEWASAEGVVWTANTCQPSNSADAAVMKAAGVAVSAGSARDPTGFADVFHRGNLWKDVVFEGLGAFFLAVIFVRVREQREATCERALCRRWGPHSMASILCIQPSLVVLCPSHRSGPRTGSGWRRAGTSTPWPRSPLRSPSWCWRSAIARGTCAGAPPGSWCRQW